MKWSCFRENHCTRSVYGRSVNKSLLRPQKVKIFKVDFSWINSHMSVRGRWIHMRWEGDRCGEGLRRCQSEVSRRRCSTVDETLAHDVDRRLTFAISPTISILSVILNPKKLFELLSLQLEQLQNWTEFVYFFKVTEHSDELFINLQSE